MVKAILNSLWQIIFKTLLVPSYKFFLFIKKYGQKYLLQNPYLSAKQNIVLAKQSSPAHIIIIIFLLFVLITNVYTRDTYAKEFNRNSIIAQVLVTDTEDEIIEKLPDPQKINQRPKTETIIGQLSALESKKKTTSQNKGTEDQKQIALSQGGEAVISPGATPFSENDQIKASVPLKKKIQHYIVQPGDTISGIANNFGISINTILWENNLSLNSYIQPGDKLTILPTSGITYTIKSGDTMGGIANRFGTTVKKILNFNDIESASNIKVRQKIIIPGGKLGHTAPARTHSIYSSSSATGNFIWPTITKRITQYYHWRHHAIDIAGRIGNPIYATRSGRVEHAGWSTGYGYNVVINHGGGVKTRYAHASQLYVKRGDQVSQGEIIAAIGSTGWSTGPHIHFEIIINGVRVNPLSYL